MRRKDREVSGISEIRAIVERNQVCRIAVVDEGKPYIIPMNFGFAEENDCFTIYLHCAKVGRKIDILKKNANICFEVDGAHELTEEETACEYSYNYESVVGFGKAEFVTETEEKKFGLNRVMWQCTKKDGFTFEEKALNAVCVIKIKLEKLKGKRR
jgi:Predicted flavin-nucleotide-binding protein